MSESAPNKLASMAKQKCPNCRKGGMFTNKSIFPLGKMMDMPEHCPNCGQKYEIELGFWYGTGYVSYGISVGLFFVTAVLFAIFYGFSYKNNSIFIFLGLAIGLMVLLQPFIMRYSRVIWLGVFVKYQSSEKIKREK
jgi:ribosomal protein S27AE